MTTPKTILVSMAGAVVLTLIIYGVTLVPRGERTVRHLETIHGIPYPPLAGAIHVDEPLAHADIFINQPVLAQNLELEIQFIPTNITNLAVGIRENSFWLSYPKYAVYEDPEAQGKNQEIQSRTVTIPLTDKLQEADQSIDLMFFAEGEAPEWELVRVKAQVVPTWPTWIEFKDYARAIVYRERAL